METVELTVEQKALADRAYKRLLSGRSLRRMKGNKDIIDLRGYDLSDVDMTLIATSSAYCELILGNNGIDEEELKRSTTSALEKRMFNLKAKNKRAYYLDRNPNGTIYYEKDYIEAQQCERKLLRIDSEYIIPKRDDGKVDIDAFKQMLVKREQINGNNEYRQLYLDEVNELRVERCCSQDYTFAEFVQAYRNGDYEYLEQNWNKGMQFCWGYPDEKNRASNQVGRMAFREGKTELLRRFAEAERKSCEPTNDTVHTPMLYSELSKSESEMDKEYILALIKAGVDLDYANCRDGDEKPVKEHIPTLYAALKIEDEATRKEIVTAMLKAGVDPTAKHIGEYYIDSSFGANYEYSCLDVNNGELRSIMQELGMAIPKVEYSEKADVVDFECDWNYAKMNPLEETRKQSQEYADNRALVTDFLIHEVGLASEEISKLEQTYSELSRDIYSLSVESLRMQKTILDSCGGTRQGFTTEARQILTKAPELLYSRLIFCREQGISISSDRLSATIGISKMGFAKNFGDKIADRGKLDERVYGRRVQQGLLAKYPMPETQEELKKDLENREKEEV